MYSFIKIKKATDQHLWFFSKQKMNYNTTELSVDFFSYFTKVFFIMPHMDDEVLGSYELINKCISLNKEITIIYCCTNEVNGKKDIKRINEAKKIFPTLQKIFLDFNDKDTVNKHDKLLNRIEEIVNPTNALYVFPGFCKANHPDHNELNKVMLEECKKNPPAKILQTEIILPIERNCFLEIQDIKKKYKTFKTYKTQLNHLNYLKILKYLSSSGGKHEYREFYSM